MGGRRRRQAPLLLGGQHVRQALAVAVREPFHGGDGQHTGGQTLVLTLGVGVLRRDLIAEVGVGDHVIGLVQPLVHAAIHLVQVIGGLALVGVPVAGVLAG